jgi:hypothetical protein
MKISWINSSIRISVAVFVLVCAHSYDLQGAAAQHIYAGCLVAPDDSVFNTPINTLPVHANSAAWIAQSLSVGSVGVSFGESWGVNLVDNSVTPTAMTFHYMTASNGILYPLLTGNNRTRENGSYTTDGNNDHHMITLNRQTCHWYETYQDNLTGSVTPTPAAYAASGWDYLSTSYTQPTDGTTDAAGLPLMPLTVHLSEMQAGAIHHAMRFTSCQGCISHQALWPATGSTAYSDVSAPMGSRWRLKASYDDSKLSAGAQVITTALKTYGMILADIGGMSQIQISQDVNLDPSEMAAFNEVGSAHITQDNFEIVDESGLMISTASHQALGGTPTDTPVLVGTTSPVIYPQAGTSYQLPSWVDGSSDQTVIWSLVSGAGAISQAGVYTAPPDVTAPESFLLKGVAEASSLNPVFVSGYVMPAGALNINVGNVWAYTDTQGNNWLADNFGVLTGSFMNNNATYPTNKWDAVGPLPIWGWSKYTWGDDIQYGPFIVPNGTYSIQAWMAVDCPAGGTYSETQVFGNGLTRGGRVGLEANGAMTLFDIGAEIQDACLTAATSTIQTVVTNNVLRVALRSTSTANTQEAPFLNALIITPVASGAAQIQPGVSALTFASQSLGIISAAQVVTLTNTGNAAASLGAASLSGANSADFSIVANTCGSSLSAGAVCQVSLTFTPSSIGARAASLIFTNSAANSPQVITLVGTGAGVPHASLSPSSLSFGTQSVGTATATQTATLSNTGAGTLSISSVTMTGTNATAFVITGSTCTSSLAAAAKCQVQLAFRPGGMGTATASLSITDSTGTQTVALSGRGKK